MMKLIDISEEIPVYARIHTDTQSDKPTIKKMCVHTHTHTHIHTHIHTYTHTHTHTYIYTHTHDKRDTNTPKHKHIPKQLITL